MQNALNTIKLQKSPISAYSSRKKQNKKSIKFAQSRLVLHVSDMGVPAPAPVPSLRKCSNIYIFNPIKNVKMTNRSTRLNVGKAHLFCAAVTCIVPKSSSSSRLRLRLPGEETKKRELLNMLHTSERKSTSIVTSFGRKKLFCSHSTDIPPTVKGQKDQLMPAETNSLV